jgi:hypothetical protein
MDDGQEMSQLANKFGVVVHRPAWEWNREQDWCCALASDLPVWVSTVKHASLNVSIPSTVTLEFAALGKPVLNVCYDLPNRLPANESNRRFWEAPHYEESRRLGLCSPAYSEKELLTLVTQSLKKAEESGEANGPDPNVQSLEKAIELVEEALIK